MPPPFSNMITPPSQVPMPPQMNFVDKNKSEASQRLISDSLTRLGGQFNTMSKMFSEQTDTSNQMLGELTRLNKQIKDMTSSQNRASGDLKSFMKTATKIGGGSNLDHGAKKDPMAFLSKDMDRTADTLSDMFKWQREHQPKKGAFDELGKYLPLIGLALMGLPDKFKDALGGVATAISSAISTVGDTLTKIMGMLSGIVSKAGEKISKGGEFVKSLNPFSSKKTKLGRLHVALDRAVAAGDEAKFEKLAVAEARLMKNGGGIGSKIGGAASKIGGAASKIGGGIGKFIGAGVGMEVGRAKSMVGGASKGLGLIGKMVSGAGKGVMGLLAMLPGGGLITGILKGLPKFLPLLGKALGIFGAIMNMKNAWDRFRSGDTVGGLLSLSQLALSAVQTAGVAFAWTGVGAGIAVGAGALNVGLGAADVAREMGAGKGTAFGKPGLAPAKPGLAPAKPGDADMNIGKLGGSIKSPQKRSMPSVIQRIGSRINSAIGNVSDMIKRGAYKFSSPGVNVSGVDPSVWGNFSAMSDEFNQATGGKYGPIPVNSGYRSTTEQAALFAKYGSGRAARPGRSMHEFGYALDIGDSGGTWMNRLRNVNGVDLVDKYGFDFPLANRSDGGTNEKWHIEPKGFKKYYSAVQSGQRVQTTSSAPTPANPAIGDANMAMPDSIRTKPLTVGTKNKPIHIKMSDEDLAKMANLIGNAFKNSIPKQRVGSSIAGVNVNPRA